MIRAERNSRGEWCAPVPCERQGYTTVERVRVLVPLPISPESSRAIADVFCAGYLRDVGRLRDDGR